MLHFKYIFHNYISRVRARAHTHEHTHTESTHARTQRHTLIIQKYDGVNDQGYTGHFTIIKILHIDQEKTISELPNIISWHLQVDFCRFIVFSKRSSKLGKSFSIFVFFCKTKQRTPSILLRKTFKKTFSSLLGSSLNFCSNLLLFYASIVCKK